MSLPFLIEPSFHLGLRDEGAPLPLGELKLLRPDLNERCLLLGRHELERVYGRVALGNGLSQARSLKRLDPAVREQRVLTRQRHVLSLRQRWLSAPQDRPPDAVLDAQQGRELAQTRERLARLDARLLVLAGEVRQRRCLFASQGVDLLDEETDFHWRQISLADRVRRRCARAERGFARGLVGQALGALEGVMRQRSGAARAFLGDALKLVLSEAIDPLLLAAPGEDPIGFARERLQRATALLGDVLCHPLTGAMAPRGLVQLSEELVKASCYPAYEGEVVVVFGGSEDPLNVRLPSYLLRPLTLIEQFHARGVVPPRLRVVNAHEVASAFNQLDPERARRVARRTHALLEAFVQRFFPALASRTQFTLPSREDFARGGILDLARRQVVSFAERHPDSRALAAVLKRARRHHRALQERPEDLPLPAEAQREVLGAAAAYTASHIVPCSFGHVRIHSPEVWEPEYVIKVGGQAERDFNYFEDLLANSPEFRPGRWPGLYRPNSSGVAKAGFSTTPIQLESVPGRRPPYYAVGPEEVGIDALDGMTFEALLQRYRAHPRLSPLADDLEALSRCGIGGEAYLDFLRRFAAGYPA